MNRSRGSSATAEEEESRLIHHGGIDGLTTYYVASTRLLYREPTIITSSGYLCATSNAVSAADNILA